MKHVQSSFRRGSVRLFACIAVACLYILSLPQGATQAERSRLAARFRFQPTPLAVPPAASQQTIRPVNPNLKNIASWISAVGAGVALADIDGDGLPNDACFVDTRSNRVIVAPVPGTGQRYAPFALDFSKIRYDVTMAPMGCVPGNFTESGRTDLLVYFWGRTPVLFLRGDGQTGALNATLFVSQEVVPGDQRWYTNALTQADVDGDGHVDLVVGNYFPDGARVLDAAATSGDTMQHSMSRALNGGGPRILLWTGATRGAHPSVTYRDATEGALPEATRHGWTLAAGAADLSGSLLPDIYLANDFGPDRLLDNRSVPGHPRFVLALANRSFTMPKSKTLGHDSFKGMGVDFADVDKRGLTDIFVSNLTESFALEESNFIFMNTGDRHALAHGVAPFVDESEARGLARSGWSWDVKLDDFDNAGDLQVLQATGFVHGDTDRWPELQELALSNDQWLHDPAAWLRVQPGDDLSGHDHDPFYVRTAGGRYIDIAPDLAIEPSNRQAPARGIAVSDAFGDGRLCFAVAYQWGDTIFERNLSPTPHRFLGLSLRLPSEPVDGVRVLDGAGPSAVESRPAIGATATILLPDGRRRVAQVDGGNGHSGRRAPELHFGLGDVPDGRLIPVDIRWRDAGGRIQGIMLKFAPGRHTVLLGTVADEGQHA